MGCAAVCGSSSSVAENNKEWEALFLTLLTQTIPNPYLYPSKQLTFFKKQAELAPHRLTLILPERLQQNSPVPSMITEKWKILLYTLDLGHSKFIECLGYSHLIVNSHEQRHTNTLKPSNEQENNQKDNWWEGEHCDSNARSFTAEIRPHKVFAQIHKDIQRSFPHLQFNHQHFTNILKRIANTFPVMGYTQGINFIVGYLLIIGYSQFDTYHLFLHLALNHRYLILGFYEDNFPLINIYICIFRSILRRTNEKLYNHLYHKVEMLQQSIWIFKWFMTLYLSSFPLEMCMYVFDFLLCTDSTALIKFAIGIVLELEEQLMEYDDACDIAQFFDGMKQIERFNELVDIRRVLKTAYKIKIQREDLDGLSNLDTANAQGQNLNNFYSEYLGVRFGQALGEERTRTPDSYEDQENTSHNRKPMEMNKPLKESASLLDTWYSNLTKERLQFYHQFSSPSKLNIQLPQETVQKPVTNLTESIIILQPSTSPPKTPLTLPVPLPNFSAHTSINIQADGKMKVKNSFSRCSIKKYVKEQSMLKWDNQEQEQYKQESQDKMEMEDEFFYMAKDIRFKRKKVEEPNDILSEYSNPEQSQSKVRKKNNAQSRHEISPRADDLRNEFQASKNTKPSTSNHNIHYSNTCSRLAYVGNSIISNLSASNSNRSSTSSHKVNHADLENNMRNLQKQNEGRNGKTKIRTEENTLGFRNCQYEQNHDTSLNTQKRMSSFIDWMINSQGPHENSNNLALSNVKQMSDAGSEVQIKGMHMFKKKNKINADQKQKKRVRERQQDDGYGGGNPLQKHGHGSESKFEYKQQSKGNGFNDEESCQSFFIGNASSRKSQICEVESVK